MSNRLQGPIIAGSTSYITEIVLLSATDGSEISGKVAADVTAYYCRQGQAPVAISLTDLANVNSVYSSGGFKEKDAVHMKGSYRLDMPNAALIAGSDGADYVELNAYCTGSQVYKERFAIVTNGPVEVLTYLTGTLATAVTGLPAAVWAVATRSLTTYGSLVSDIATAVWGAGTRTLSSYGTLVADVATGVWSAGSRSLNSIGNIINGILDEALSGHQTTGTVGKGISSAASAGDPWATPIPGSYTGSEAGNLVGNMFAAIWGYTSRTLTNIGGAFPTVADIVAGVMTAINANPAGIRRGQGLAKFTFSMVDLQGNPAPSANVTARRRLDGVWGNCANAVNNIGSGDYEIDWAPSDTDGDVVYMKYTAPNCRPRTFTIITEP